MSNLAPKEFKKKMSTEIILRLLATFLALSFLVGVLAVLVLAPGVMFLLQSKNTALVAKDKFSKVNTSSDTDKQRIMMAKNYVDIVNRHKSNYEIVDVFEKVTASVPSGVKITSLSYKANEADNNLFDLNIKMMVTSPTTFLNYKDILAQSDYFNADSVKAGSGSNIVNLDFSKGPKPVTLNLKGSFAPDVEKLLNTDGENIVEEGVSDLPDKAPTPPAKPTPPTQKTTSKTGEEGRGF